MSAMTPTGDMRTHPRFAVVDIDTARAHRMATVRHLLEQCNEADGRPPLGDHAVAAASDPDSESRAVVVRDRCGHAVAFCQATPDGGVHRTWTVDIAIDPRHRHDGANVFGICFDALLDRIDTHGGGDVQWWSHVEAEAGRRIVERHGLFAHRRLIEMQTRLDVVPRLTIPTRSFVMGADDRALLDVNNEAFADHPDQGNWTPESLAGRVSSDWFDPTGVRIHPGADGSIAGFCWTKVHRTGSAPLGEIYVVAVRPDLQGRGFGRRLVEAGLADLHERGIDRVMLFVDGDNAAARRVYEHLGFEETSTSTAYRRTSTVLRVQVCDGCCCGTDRKHPGVDHDLIRRRLAQAAAASGGRCRVVGCVDECSRSNVVIVRPAGVDGDRVWIGEVLDADVVDGLCAWLRVGAPLPVPAVVAAHVIERIGPGSVAPTATSVPVRISSDT